MVSLVAVLLLGLVASVAPAQTRVKGTVLAWLGFPDQHVIGHDSSQLQTTKKKGQQPVMSKKPVSKGNLTSTVQQTYKWLPSSLNTTQIVNNVTGIQVKYEYYQDQRYDVRQINISTPLMDTCRPKVSDVIPLARGLYCDPISPHCAESVEFKTTHSYQSSMGFTFGTTISAEENFIVAKTSVSATFGTSYDYTWGEEDETSTSYTFDLLPDGYCTASMVHIELECDTAAHNVCYDTAWMDCNGNDN